MHLRRTAEHENSRTLILPLEASVSTTKKPLPPVISPGAKKPPKPKTKSLGPLNPGAKKTAG
jgi:hypothetical protein